jgi:hypothetical protein
LLFALNPRSSQAYRSALRSPSVRDNACAQRKAALKGQHFIPFSAPKTGAAMDVGLAWMTRDGPASRPERRLQCARLGDELSAKHSLSSGSHHFPIEFSKSRIILTTNSTRMRVLGRRSAFRVRGRFWQWQPRRCSEHSVAVSSKIFEIASPLRRHLFFIE